MISPTEDVTQPKPALSRHFPRTSSANRAFPGSLRPGGLMQNAEKRSPRSPNARRSHGGTKKQFTTVVDVNAGCGTSSR